MDEYNAKAQKFLADTQSDLTVTFKKYGKHFVDDTDKRDIYTVTLSRGSRKYEFAFGQSLAHSGIRISLKDSARIKNVIPTEHYHKWKNLKRKGTGIKWFINIRSLNTYRLEYCDTVSLPVEPNAYDILACLTTYDPGDFEEFCSNYGYGNDSIKAMKTYKAVVKEYQNLAMLYNDDELEKLGRIN